MATGVTPPGDSASGSLQGNPALFAGLEEEARWVACAMAETREQCLARLNRPQPPFAHPGAGQEPGGSDLRGPLGFSPFYYFPFLFADAFLPLPRAALRTLSLSNRILLEAILVLDRHIDETRPWTPEDLFLVDAYHQRAMEILFPLFPAEHTFWKHAETCFVRYARAVTREQILHRHRLSEYGDREFFSISAGKVALIRTTLQAMASLSGRTEFLAPLLASQSLFLVGFQAFDDLKDWKEDLRNRNFTQLLTEVFRQGGFLHRVERADFPTTLDVGTSLYCRGMAREQLRRAENYFARSLSVAKNTPVPLWKEVVGGFLKSCRDMRLDFSEIHRRIAEPPADHAPGTQPTRGSGTARQAGADTRASPKEICDRILSALSFLEGRQLPRGGFRLYASPRAYMNPATPLAASRGVTRLTLRCLSPLRKLHPALERMVERADRWLAARPHSLPADPSLPAPFERAFLCRPGSPRRLLAMDQDDPCCPSDRFPGLFWTDLLYHASCQDIRLPVLEMRAGRCLRFSDCAAWAHPASSRAETGSGPRAACRPLLPLFLLLQAPGPGLVDVPLRARLLRSLLKGIHPPGGWGNATDTALQLLCLLSAGHDGEEGEPGLEKLIHLQEPDGSWSPNAFYKQDALYFGSRELTTVWCMLALFLSACWNRPTARTPVAPAGGTARGPAVSLHERVPPHLRCEAQDQFRRLEGLLPLSADWDVFLGTWQDMPPHFLVPEPGRLLIGINLTRPVATPFHSTAFRPLKTEITLALFTAERVRLRGPLRDRLERMYVLGLALWVCGLLAPELPFHRQAGMSPLDERWCTEHEPYLWSRVREFLIRPDPAQGPFLWLLPADGRPRPGPIPEGTPLYLGRRLFDGGPSNGSPGRQEILDRLHADHGEIHQAFRIRAGVTPKTHSLFRRSFHETPVAG